MKVTIKYRIKYSGPAESPRPLIRFDVIGCGLGIWVDGKASGTGMDVKVDKYGKVIATRSKLGLPTLYVTPVDQALPVVLWITTNRRDDHANR
jgi:hypothetical protein